ncbi:MAG: hypothetical protein A3I44_00125 [Candidatus Sungbacteria bacterium RIFCSPLOWO2_02_FULL_51_17]|uniref:Uncharacterized protein n=1 Tax=Candidatus Sungbacteria bacterium RIFCSPHIGHO2_02_FULL_51_29 TaxID=1802273 RepID=A0A1G2KTZ9_9BACT|nr:MAG: hypothetical protein A2676_05560 [Candidatus Sungbacteria bacterium RIFCSPHIGHO2_01_FULL_51_22]OHA02917.1 MAG: hypothetical protein A3C16_04975 [Candidatus Sungbacteria bacterium RIFCSPHIGHO2_02_FULL_51_29]OHA06298.1 MAG: hypothetical protein A3B29_03485 [Candidatus Sungbacteria bacterium RIFCSPLOWO2_01_FULL_51_34]OHA11563.1 MAG: hypothetical protein A3I44_00125 [Candidatus Sungbacteria bacterium RIFCSPLOWO2_02_FULL_51_17]
MSVAGFLRRVLHMLMGVFARVRRARVFMRYDDCAHCWGSYPHDQIVRCDLFLWHPIEIRNGRDERVGSLRAPSAQNTPLCHECKDGSPVLFKILLYPWGVEYLWWSAATGHTYRRKRMPEKPGFNILPRDDTDEL